MDASGQEEEKEGTTAAPTEDSDSSEEPTEVTQEPTEVTQEPTEVTQEPTKVTQEPTEATTEPTEATTEPTEVTTAKSVDNEESGEDYDYDYMWPTRPPIRRRPLRPWRRQ